MPTSPDITLERCPRCGASVAEHARAGFCSQCLAAVSLAEGEAAPASEDELAAVLPRTALAAGRRTRFGDYELLEEIARGGMGVVYRARQRSLNRIVAIKTLLFGGFAGEEGLRRFRLEAASASALEHPNIVRILDVGDHDGQPFLAMDYVAGRDLARLVIERPLLARQAAGYVEKIARAVEFAHQHGVLHRDLKSSNVLIDAFDEPRVTDFGLAKQFEPVGADVRRLTSTTDAQGGKGEREKGRVSGETPSPGGEGRGEGGYASEAHRELDQSLLTSAPTSHLTRTGQPLGSPGFMPPEQAEGDGRRIGPASDVYGLGAILYHLLTSRPPFLADTFEATLRQVLDRDPIPLRQFNPNVPADLETICLKCLEKEPAKRYPTAQALADELGRFLKDEPIRARPITPVERAWRWCRRKPALAIAHSLLLLLLVVILIGSPLALYRINQARQAEQVQLQRAEAGELKARQVAYASDMNLAHQAVQEDDFYRALQLLDRHRPAERVESKSELSVERDAKANVKGTSSSTLNSQLTPLSTDLRGWEWRYLWRQCQGEERFILGEHTNGATAVGLLADGKTVFSAGRDKMVRLWDLESRRQIGLLPHADEVIGAAASPDGRWLATTTAKEGEARPVLLWDLATRKIAATLTTITSDFTNLWLRPGSITFSPDSRWLAFATHFGGVRLWDVQARSEATNLPSFNKLSFLFGLAFSPDSRTLAYNENDYGAILLWDIAHRSVIGRLTGHQGAVTALAFSPDGQTLASGSRDRTTRVWNLAGRRERFVFTNQTGGSGSVAFSPDSRTLAMTGAGRMIRFVEIETGNQKAERRGHLKNISSLAFAPDGQTLLSASDDGTIRVWDSAPRAKESSVLEFARNSISTEWSSYGPALFLSPDGRHLLTVYTNQTFSLWDTLRLVEGERHPLPFTNTLAAAVAPGGRIAAFGSWSGEVMLWDAGTGQGRFFARVGTNKIHRLAFSPDGRYLAIANDTKILSDMAGSNDDKRRTIRVWDVGSQKETHVFSPDGEFPVSLTFSADAKSLLVGCWRGPVKLWPLDGPGAGATFLGHSAGVRGLALLPDGLTLISAAQEIRFWDVRTGHETDHLNPRAGRFFGVALSADGRRLATGGSDGRITIWDIASRQEVATLEGHQESVMYLAFTPDGDRLVSVSKDQLRVWRAASSTEADVATGFQELNPH